MAFVIRAEGFVIDSCEPGKEGQELEFTTYDEAEDVMLELRKYNSHATFEIVEI
ncbi:TPA: hypothetical protein ROY30_005219 [Bacillus cereus]|uniref:hypothetical protein n=1 Tax=Bacillales TaxID=1385 RepID=UPI001C3029CC|nr:MULTISPECIES: hypothetical protein [Bacillales]MCP1181284.1 hypothetical protein [Bacillus sp. 1663tsa1]MCU5751588.1 hypothetical protein [Bacillus cereus]HDX9631467.1 hypothetical protein [Bacillus cereus]